MRDILKVIIETQSFTTVNASSVDELSAALDGLATTVADVNGYKIAPLFIVYERSAGTFGNNIAVRFAFDPSMESQVADERFYTVASTDTSTGLKLTPTVSFTFDEDYTYLAESLFATDVFETYNPKLGMYVSSHMSDFRKVVAASGLNAADGLALAGGSDGSFDLNADKTVRALAMSTAMADVYNGTVTDTIYDEIRYQFIHVLDNDDSALVKDAVENLCAKRYTSIAVLSNPSTITAYTQAESLRKSVYKYDTFSAAMYTESAMVIDPYTHKRVRMPASYFNSFTLASHCVNKGFALPFAGKYYKWTGFIAGTMKPQSTSTVTLKTEHELRLNQMFEDGKGNASPYQQITMQSTMSKLSELNNVHILKFMIRISLIESDAARWDFNSDTDIVKFQKTVAAAVDLQLNGLYDSFSVVCSRESANGAGANRILAAINVTFKNVLKGVTYQFYIN